MLNNDLPNITWPAFIKFNGSDDLHYINDIAQWQADHQRGEFSHCGGERLIDAKGKLYLLANDHDTVSLTRLNGEYCSVEQGVSYAKAYAAQENFCCSAKIFATTYHELFIMIKYLSEL